MFLYVFLSVIFIFSQLFCSQQQTKFRGFQRVLYVDEESNGLYSAIVKNNEPSFNYELGLKEGQDQFEFRNLRKETLCHTAVSCQRNEMLKNLAPKVDPDAQAFDGQTASHYAVFHNNRDALQTLGKHRASIEIGDNDGVTPLALAVRLDRKAIAEGLLRRNANVHAKNKYGHQPLHHARSATMVRRLLANGANIDAQGMYKDTPIAFAVKNSLYDVVKELLESGALTTYVDERGNRLLHLARDGRIAQLLIDAGLDVHAENKKGDKPLHSAAKLILPGVASVLMQSGAIPGATNELQQTPLHGVRSVEVAQTLLARGACVQALDYNNNNVLHSMLLKEKKCYITYWADVGEFLLNSGLNSTRLNSYMKTVLNLAIHSKFCDMLRLLEESHLDMHKLHFPQRVPSLAYAAGENFIFGVNMFLRLGMPLKDTDFQGRNAFHYAADANSFACLKMLVSSYAGPDKVSILNLPDICMKNTPLHYAVIDLNVECVEILLSHGASHSPVNARGLTPMHYVQGRSDKKAQEIKNILFERVSSEKVEHISKKTKLNSPKRYL